jgi:hypothetical protein
MAEILSFELRKKASPPSPLMQMLKDSLAIEEANMEIRRGQALIRTGASLIGRHASPTEALRFLKEVVREAEEAGP